MAGKGINSGRSRARTWRLQVKQALFSETGKFYQPLTRFPAALLDGNGYVVFQTQSEYEACAFLQRGVRLNVPKAISAIPGYVAVMPSGTHGTLPPPPSLSTMGEHEDLIGILQSVGDALGFVVEKGQGPAYKHDLSLKVNVYQSPKIVIEVCDKGNVDKDITSLQWAEKSLGAKGILVTVDDREHEKAAKVIGYNPNVIVVRAAIRQLHSMVGQMPLLKVLFGS